MKTKHVLIIFVMGLLCSSCAEFSVKSRFQIEGPSRNSPVPPLPEQAEVCSLFSDLDASKINITKLGVLSIRVRGKHPYADVLREYASASRKLGADVLYRYHAKIHVDRQYNGQFIISDASIHAAAGRLVDPASFDCVRAGGHIIGSSELEPPSE